MVMHLFGHPFSSYTWKAQIAFYENDIPFEFRMIDPEHPDNSAELARRSAMGKFPLLVDGEASVFEATAIIEYLEALHPGRLKLIPTNPEAAVKARMMDRVFDNYVMNVTTLVVVDALHPDEHRDHHGVERALANLERIYAWLDAELAGRDWACGAEFTLADCAAGPSLFYADWVHPIAEQHSRLKAYRGRLIARPSVARCVEDARPYRAYFPLGAPDRD